EVGGSASSDSGGRGRRPGGPPSSSRPAAPPATALAGGSVVATVPPPADEKVFAWKHGETLNALKELPKAEGQKLLSRLGASAEDPATAAAAPNSVPITVSSGDDR